MKKISLFALTLLAAQISFAQSTDPTPYCDASFDDMDGTFPVDDHIGSVAFGSLLNISGAQYAAPHYVFYDNLAVPDFKPDSTYTLTVAFRVAGAAGYGVWIDYNHNNIFEASEAVTGSSGTDFLDLGDSTLISQGITIPATATLGPTRMRVRIVEDDNHNMNNAAELPCNISNSASDVMDWGETEDYTINIQTADTAGNTGVQDINAMHKVKVLPNPSNGRFMVTADAAINNLEIYSLSGQLIYKTSASKNQVAIDLSTYAKGIYFIRVNSHSQWTTGQLVLR